MEKLIDAQRELYGRIARLRENLRKTGAAKMTSSLVQSAVRILDSKWTKVEALHECLITDFGDRLEEHDYTKEDFMGTIEAEYLHQRAELEAVKLLGETAGGDEAKPAKTEASVSRTVLPRSYRSFPDNLKTGLRFAISSVPSSQRRRRCLR